MAKKNSIKSSERFSQSELLNNALEYIFKEALFPYQREFVKDNSRFKIANKARQIGLSTCLGLEGVMDAIQGESVYYVSRTEKQSVYLLDKFFKWADFLRQCGVEFNYESKTKTECKIVGGADVKSLTSSACAGEGFSGNVYLDEFALHDNDREIYRSLYPTITWGYKIRIISRPFGQSNLFYDIFTDLSRYPDYSRHKYDIYRAVKDGLPIDPDELRRNFDEDAFAENYECKFIDESTSFYPYELIRPCIGEYASEGTDGQVYCGIDVGRKSDATIIYLLVKLGNIFYTKRIESLRNFTFDAQIEEISRIFKDEKVSHCCIDSTGFGMQMAESLKKRFGFIVPINFNIHIKEHLVLNLKRKFENKEIRIPDDQQLIYDLHAIRRFVTAGNQVSYDSKRNSQGHGDRFWAFALALKSAESSNAPRIILLNELEEEENFYADIIR